MLKVPRVLIIGAGPAGIAAAAKLLENGFSNVTILEAESRIGGRIHSVEFGEGFVDLGAQWIHGETGNIVYEMVKHLDLVSKSHNDYSKDFTFYLSTGKTVDKHITDKLYNILATIVFQDKDSSYHGSFEDYVKEEYIKRIREEFPHDQNILELSKAMEEWFCKYYITYDAAESLSDFSLSNTLGDYVQYEGHQTINWRDKGYKTFLDVLMKKTPNLSTRLPVEDKVQLNKKVTRILWNETTHPNTVMVKCSDDTSYVADHVIVTVSLGVLKNNHSKMFSPPLPPFKVRAIQGLCFGSLVKIFLQFRTKWWPHDFKECPHFEPSNHGRSWLEDIWGFYVVDSQPRVLLGWLTGKNAKRVELLPEEIVRSSCMFLLRKFAGDIYEIPEPEGILRSTWSTNTNFEGVYSYHGMETERLKCSPSDLAVPLSAPGGAEVVLFAGEATSMQRYSTVDGAVESGYREAQRIIEAYRTSIYTKIAIVGAGMAGLGAGLKLQELNVDDYILIEADDEPGGRIKTIYVNDKPVDLGAQWLHGRDNPLYRLAEKEGLLAKETSEEGLGLFIRNDGTIVDEDLVKKVNWEIGIILEDCRCFMEENEYPQSLGDYLEKRFTEYLNASKDDPEITEIKKQLLDWHIRFQIVDNSCHSLKRLSAKYWGSYICLDDEAHSNLKDGYKALVEAIVERLPKANVICNTTVTSIDYGGNKIVLECNDKTVICDHLILTPSLESISAMGFEGIAKIFLFFKERWWGDTKGFQLLFDSKLALKEDEKWVKYLTGFDDVFNHPNALLGWVGSEGVKQVEALEEQVIGKCCTKLLRQFLPGYKISEPILVIRTKWLSNPLIRGSYSHITPECDKSIGVGIEGLSKPIRGLDGVPRILLAGEAVHPSHYSTTHGAFESGAQQAAWIAEYLKADEDTY
nr:unnamed protein product [Callosobruchus analis]